MAQSVETVMTQDPVCMDADTPLIDAAKAMDERDIGDVLERDRRSVLGEISAAPANH